jgi:hypothetical protein
MSENIEERIENAMTLYMEEVSEARDRYVVSMKKERLNKEEKEIMYAEEDKGEISWKEELMESEQMIDYFGKVQTAREEFMQKNLKDRLSDEDRIKFKDYEELADYFAGGNVVKTLYKGHGHEDAKFGIMIYGKEYWMKESDIEI